MNMLLMRRVIWYDDNTKAMKFPLKKNFTETLLSKMPVN